MVDDELWTCGRNLRLDCAILYEARVVPDALLLMPAARLAPRWLDVIFLRRSWLLAAQQRCAVHDPELMLADRGALALFFGE
jgi:hypothetical protein